MLREALKRMGRADLIGPGKQQLIPAWQPLGTGGTPEGRRTPKGVSPARTQHTGLKGTKIPARKGRGR